MGRGCWIPEFRVPIPRNQSVRKGEIARIISPGMRRRSDNRGENCGGTECKNSTDDDEPPLIRRVHDVTVPDTARRAPVYLGRP